MTVHRFETRVYYEDTDAAGIVYYANYLKFAERARTEILRAAGISQHEIAAEDRVAFPVRAVAVEYLKPAKLDDALLIESELLELGGATARVRQAVKRLADGADLAVMDVRLACVKLDDGRPTRWPAPVKAALALHATGARHIPDTKT
ncbi:MAG: YbgC/FadM family acyl-CoA thioesterase [Azospirillum sp.]|nr:YbgC/FadM family acyl-CoA thioesterase [Azospirillum sp.]